MDIESVGVGGGGGIIGSILTYLGFKQRMDAVDKRVEALEADTVYRDVHAECSRSWHDALNKVDNKLDIILAKIDKP